MNNNQASNIWDSIKNGGAVPFLAGNDEVFPVNQILTPEQTANVLDIMDSLDKSSGSKMEEEAEMRLRDSSGAPKHSTTCRNVRAEGDQAEDAIHTAQDELNALLDQLDPPRPTPREETPRTDPPPSPPSHLSDLLTNTKHQLAGMRPFAAFAKDNFRDPELGIRYQKAFLRRIDKAMALLNSYADYLSLRSPVRKTNTINNLIEKVFNRHAPELKDQHIEIIKKQFAEDLPETTVPEEQLEYILHSLMQYIAHSTSPRGNLGLLTRLLDAPKEDGEKDGLLGMSRKDVEILFVFSTPDRKNDTPSPRSKGQGMELILCLVREIVERNKGSLELKPSDKNAMTFISLRVPVERRTVLEFRPL